MFVHPVQVIIVLSILTLGLLAWTIVSSRRAQRISRHASGGTTETLNRRVAVLEKIVTDPATHLAREIDGLRSEA